MLERYQILKKELLAFESLMDQAHNNQSGDLSEESMKSSKRIGRSWLDLMMFGKEVLSLNNQEERKLEKLFADLLKGDLNNDDREEDVDALIKLKLRFEKARGENTEEVHVLWGGSWKQKARTTLLIFLVGLIFFAAYVYARLITLVLG